jgi:hypothetical protein
MLLCLVCLSTVVVNIGEVILKLVYERVTEQGVWKITTDQKLQESYKTPDLVADITRGHSE